MRTLALPIAFIAVFCALFTATTYADALIFNNSNYTGYVYAPDYSYTEMLDYGTSQGGRISKFVFGYASGSSAGTIWVRFYQGTNRYDTGYLIRQFALTAVPGTNGYVDTYEYVIPEDQRFQLPSGDFGYSFEFSSSATDIALATGGDGVDRYFWEDLYGTGVLWPVYFDVAYNFYFQVYTAPPINEVTCDIAGYKFNDLNANGIWDAGEPNLPGWEIYVDANNNNQYDPGTDPNAVTDPNGMYFFENLPSPATYTIREVLPNGWTQTLPGSGSGYEYIIATEPNRLYGPYTFGNTTFTQKYSGGDGSAQNPYQISTCEDLDSIGTHTEDHNKYFVLTNDIDLCDYPSAVFNKINYFAGIFNGQNYTVRDFNGVIRLGMFGQIQSTGIVKNLNIINLAMDFGGYYSGGLAGTNVGQISNCHVYGTNLGITRYVGGLVGYNSPTGIISNCSFEGSVSGDEAVGGLVGFNYKGQILASFVRADVEGRTTQTGGLVGMNFGGVINNCYSIGSVTGNHNTGGFVGSHVFENATIQNSYCIGNVSGNFDTGGFSGEAGFCDLIGCFWNIDLGFPPYFSIGGSGEDVSEDVQGLTTEQMQMMSTYTGWDFDTVWRICDGMNYPRLQWEPRPAGDFACPEGVELTDLMVLCDEWLMEAVPLSADIAPPGAPDGKVNLRDFALFAENWLAGTDP